MNNLNPAVLYVALTLVIAILSGPALALELACEKAYPSSDDLWSVDTEFVYSHDLYEFLLKRGAIKSSVTFDEFDYIFVLTNQICGLYLRVDTPLALAMISCESGFDRNCESSAGAKGLMQLLTIIHSKRMSQFVENDHEISLEDFFDPRLNVATGVDYMNYILSETKGDLHYALMWYNQGPIPASKDYLDNHVVSGYAKAVSSLANDIRTFMEERSV